MTRSCKSSRAAARIHREVAQPLRLPPEGIREAHLEFIRKLPCVACGRPPPSRPMHVRISRASLGKFNTMARKPDDKYTVPGCDPCHSGDQHTTEGERAFWERLGIDPLDLALRLWSVTGDIEAGTRAVFRARQSIALHRRQHVNPEDL